MSGRIRPHQSRIALLQRLADAAVIAGTLLATTLMPRVVNTDGYGVAALLAVVAFTFIADLNGLYQSWRGERISSEIIRAWWCWLLVATLLLIAGFFSKTSLSFSRVAITVWFLAAPIGLSALRWAGRQLLRTARDRGYNRRRAGIVGSGPLAQMVAKTLDDNPAFGIVLKGFFDDHGEDLSGDLDELVSACENNKIDVVYMALPLDQSRRIQELTERLQNSTASVYLVPDLAIFDLMQSRVHALGDVPVISIMESPFYGIDGWVKRAEDVVVGSIILTLILLPMAAIGAAVKLTSKGPMLFKQRRYGLNGKEIWVWKFRSMSVMEDGDDVPQAKRGDARITPLGAFLRKTSLDELPQFFNVLTGQMSIVGPRPHAVAHNEQYRKVIGDYMLRHKVKPGITGWAQINGWRGETDTLEKMQKRVEYDLYYIRNWSVRMDLKIILLTVLRGFTGNNAY